MAQVESVESVSALNPTTGYAHLPPERDKQDWPNQPAFHCLWILMSKGKLRWGQTWFSVFEGCKIYALTKVVLHKGSGDASKTTRSISRAAARLKGQASRQRLTTGRINL